MGSTPSRITALRCGPLGPGGIFGAVIPEPLRPVQRLFDHMARSQTGAWTEQMAQTWAAAHASVDTVLRDLSGRSGRRWTRVLREAAEVTSAGENPTFSSEFRRELLAFYMSVYSDLVPPMSPERERRLLRDGGRFGFRFE